LCIEFRRKAFIIGAMKILRRQQGRIHWVLLLSVFMFFAQTATLEHGAEHSSHAHEDLCQSFIAFDNSALCTLEVPLDLTSEFFNAYHAQNESAVYDEVLFSALIRAPPASNFS